MSLSDRLRTVIPHRPNRGCETCLWLSSLNEQDRKSFDAWIEDGNSLLQLWEIAASMEDNPLTVSNSALRHHIKHHKSSSS